MQLLSRHLDSFSENLASRLFPYKFFYKPLSPATHLHDNDVFREGDVNPFTFLPFYLSTDYTSAGNPSASFLIS